MNIFIDNLKRIMAERDINQRQLAKLTGLSEQSISRYINGTRNPNLNIINKIAKGLDISVESLTSIIDERKYIDVTDLSDEEIIAIKVIINCIKKNRMVN